MGEERSGVVLLIGAFKLLKGLLLVAVALGALKLVHGGPQELFERIGEWSHLSPEGRHIQRIASKIAGLDEKQLTEIAFGSFAYAAIFLVEGAGLLARKHWAEWLTVIVTASFIPFEIWHFAREPAAGKIAALVVNLAVVVYLMLRIRRRRSRMVA